MKKSVVQTPEFRKRMFFQKETATNLTIIKRTFHEGEEFVEEIDQQKNIKPGILYIYCRQTPKSNESTTIIEIKKRTALHAIEY